MNRQCAGTSVPHSNTQTQRAGERERKMPDQSRTTKPNNPWAGNSEIFPKVEHSSSSVVLVLVVVGRHRAPLISTGQHHQLSRRINRFRLTKSYNWIVPQYPLSTGWLDLVGWIDGLVGQPVGCQAAAAQEMAQFRSTPTTRYLLHTVGLMPQGKWWHSRSILTQFHFCGLVINRVQTCSDIARSDHFPMQQRNGIRPHKKVFYTCEVDMFQYCLYIEIRTCPSGVIIVFSPFTWFFVQIM